MEWTKPKTNWAFDSSQKVDSNYFNLSDYNRIKNNNIYLVNMVRKYYPLVDDNMYTYRDLDYGSYLLADDVNKITEDIERMYISMDISYVSDIAKDLGIEVNDSVRMKKYIKRYFTGGRTMTWEELNIIEKMQEVLYKIVTNVANDQPILPIQL